MFALIIRTRVGQFDFYSVENIESQNTSDNVLSRAIKSIKLLLLKKKKNHNTCVMIWNEKLMIPCVV